MNSIEKTFQLNSTDILRISAKTGFGIEQVFNRIIESMPHPSGNLKKPFQGLLFDSTFDTYQGVICSIAVSEGIVRKGMYFKVNRYPA